MVGSVSLTCMLKPHEVISPMEHWKLAEVIFDGGPEGPRSFSVAIGTWEGEPRLAMRWNCNPSRPKGPPHSSGHPVWFILPDDFAVAVAERTLRLLARAEAGGDAERRARRLVAWLVDMGLDVSG